MRLDTEISASPFDRRRVFTTPSAVLTLGISFGLVCQGPSVSRQQSSQDSATNTTTATDEAVVVTGGQNVGPGGAGTESGDIVGGSQITGGSGDITIESADAATLEKGLEAIATLAGGFGDSLTDILANIDQSNKSGQATQQANLSSVLGSIATLAEGKQTEGGTYFNKTLLYIGLAVALVAIVFFWRRR